mgnify:CR=1 FL=1
MYITSKNKGNDIAFDWTIQQVNSQPKLSYMNSQHLKGFYAHLLTTIEHLKCSHKKNKIALIIKHKKMAIDIRQYFRKQGQKLPLKFSLTPKLSKKYLPRFGPYGIRG